MGYSKAGLAILALPLLTGVVKAQTVQRLVNVQETGNWYTSGAIVESLTTLGGESAMQVQMNTRWGQTGVVFGAPVDWSAYKGFLIRVKNHEAYPLAIGMQWDTNSAGTLAAGASMDLAANEEAVFFVDFNTPPLNALGMVSPLPAQEGFYKHRYPWGSTNLSAVYRWQVYLRDRDAAKVEITSLRGVPSVALPSAVSFVDRYGQYANQSWPWKVSNPQQMVQQKADEDADLALNADVAEIEGSTSLPPAAAPGSWRVIRSRKDKAYFVSPAGNRFWSLGVCHVIRHMDTVVEDRQNMFQNLPDPTSTMAQFYGTAFSGGRTVKTYSHYSANLYEKLGENWRQEAASNGMRRLRSWGFNTMGSGSDLGMLSAQPLPFTFTLSTRDYPTRVSGPGWAPKGVPDPFASNFEDWAKTRFTADLGIYLNNPNLLGCYVDGELPWGLRNGAQSEYLWLPLAVLKAPQTQPAKGALIKRLVAKYGTIQNLNQSWGTNYASWSSLRSNQFMLMSDQVIRSRPDLTAFLQSYVETYASKVKNVLKAVKSDMLYLGGREAYHTSPNEAFKAMEAFADVVSVTFFDDTAYVPWDYFNSLSKPVLITEFSFTAREGNSFPQTAFPRIDAASQTERAERASRFLDTALSSRNVIGVHWFDYIDQPLTARAGSTENMAFGLVDVTDRPYPEMVDMFRNFSRTMYARRGM